MGPGVLHFGSRHHSRARCRQQHLQRTCCTVSTWALCCMASDAVKDAAIGGMICRAGLLEIRAALTALATVWASAIWTLACVTAWQVSVQIAAHLTVTCCLCMTFGAADARDYVQNSTFACTGWSGDDCTVQQPRPCTNVYHSKGSAPQGPPESWSTPGWTASRCAGSHR